MPEESLKKLPSKAQSLWEAAFNTAKKEGFTDERAAMVAWGAVKEQYRKSREGVWVLKGGFVTTQEVILRTFEADGDFYFEGYVTSWEPDNGDLTSANNGESIRISPEAGAKIAADLESFQLGGGIEHDTSEQSKNFNKAADKVFSVVKAEPDSYGIKALMKLNKYSKRFLHAKEGILRGLYQGLSLEVFPAQNGFTYETSAEGRAFKNLLRVARTGGVTLTKEPLDNGARIGKTFQTKIKTDGRRTTSKEEEVSGATKL